MRLFDKDGWPNFSTEDGIRSVHANIIMMWGGRGTGKTFTALKTMCDERRHYLYLRRTPGQVDTIAADADMWPFSPLNAAYHWDYQPRKVKGAKSMWKVVSGPDDEEPLGTISSVVNLGRTRGFSAPDTDYILLDEYQKDDLDFYRKGEGVGLANIYETVNRNRELLGRPPCTLIMMSNAVGMANPYFMQWDVIDIVDRMIATRRRWLLLPDRGILLIDLADSPIAAAKKDTALYKSLAGTDFYRSALENNYAAEERSTTGSKPLTQYRPIVTVGRLTIYQAKGAREYYVTEHKSGTPPQYGTGHYDLQRFRARYRPMYTAYMDRKITFEKYSDEIYFRELWGGLTFPG